MAGDADPLAECRAELEEATRSLVRLIAALLDARDTYTLGHAARVARMSCEFARFIGIEEEETLLLERAALLHDIGKVQISDVILHKKSRLNAKQEEKMREHPVTGADILWMAPLLHQYIPVVRAHHEWHNGGGYPDGLKGDEIPLHARIISLADVFDAMTSNRPYRRALSVKETMDEILRVSGAQFSAAMANKFLRMVGEKDWMDRRV
jgi:putative nucleotidyltransferase with HDIG domain